jgi:hypothetical protein
MTPRRTHDSLVGAEPVGFQGSMFSILNCREALRDLDVLGVSAGSAEVVVCVTHVELGLSVVRGCCESVFQG